jgi:hypothetical protein
MAELPDYDALPVDPASPPGSAWGVWGDHDVLGCLNLLTPERARVGVACVRDGATFPLNLELELPGPPLFGRPGFVHEVSGAGDVGHDDALSGWNTQSSSQWDGFRHIRHPLHGFYGGVAVEDHGMHFWARRGIVGRAVVCDVFRWRASVGRPIQPMTDDLIEPSDVTDTLAAQGVAVEVGDILLLHTGWVDHYRTLSADERAALAGRGMKATGLVPGVATARMLWNLHIAAVAADNPALEAWPPRGFDPEGFVHFHLLPLLGLPIGELWDIGPLAAACAADGRYTCLLTSAPLNLDRGVASPPNALAIR